MKANILSLNVGHPAPMVWQGRTIVSSMLKNPVPGPLQVGALSVDGDSFASPEFHGTPDSVLYALGLPSALKFVERLGLKDYAPGTVGENLLLSELDEELVSAGDVFRIGEVEAQATYPRIPCGKVCYRMQHADGQNAMNECGRSGVYFRILKTGRIAQTDTFERISRAAVLLPITEIYRYHLAKAWPDEAKRRALENGALPKRMVEKFAGS